MSVDPLAEKYAYNSTYAFQENKMGMGRELEGLELVEFGLLGTTEIIEAGIGMEEVVPEVTSKTEGHHIIPKALKGNPVVETAAEEGFKFEGAENKIDIQKFSRATGQGRHGNHPNYSNNVLDKLGEFAKNNGENANPGDALEFLRNLTGELRKLINNNPTTKINDLFKVNAGVVIDNTRTQKPVLPKPKPTPPKPTPPKPKSNAPQVKPKKEPTK